jgi:hypothetical protein
MPLTPQLARKFQDALPGVRQWIDELLATYAGSATAVSQLAFPRISRCFPQDFLEMAKVVLVKQLPNPPFDRWGLPELANALPTGEAISFKDTFFLLEQFRRSESLHFHELVHVAQWQTLNTDRFLITYAAGLAEFGYRNSPLEMMAFNLYGEFDHGVIRDDLLPFIRQSTEEIWKQVDAAIRGLAE